MSLRFLMISGFNSRSRVGSDHIGQGTRTGADVSIHAPV